MNTIYRCGTGASNSSPSHNVHSARRFAQRDGQKRPSENGIHALSIIDRQRLWGGQIDFPLSYGRAAVGIRKAEYLLNWAELGPPVVIHYWP